MAQGVLESDKRSSRIKGECSATGSKNAPADDVHAIDLQNRSVVRENRVDVDQRIGEARGQHNGLFQPVECGAGKVDRLADIDGDSGGWCNQGGTQNHCGNGFFVRHLFSLARAVERRCRPQTPEQAMADAHDKTRCRGRQQELSLC
jgi:hypothetical protein